MIEIIEVNSESFLNQAYGWSFTSYPLDRLCRSINIQEAVEIVESLQYLNH